MSSVRAPLQAKPRRTIAVLVDHINFVQGGWEAQMRRAFHETCRELDTNLVIVAGRSLDDANPASAAHSIIYDWVRGPRVDGAVLLSPTLGNCENPSSLHALCERLAPMPMVSMGMALEGTPSLIVDNHAGMAAIVEHLVVSHGCRKIAFVEGIHGNEEARVRRLALDEALEAHGLSLDPRLTVRGDFIRQVAHQAAFELLDSGLDFDAVIAANDGSAMGVITAFREWGVRIPEDVALTGFDDLAASRLTAPPLTTVAQPLEYMAETAIRQVVDLLEGRPVDAVTSFDLRVVVRESCGCKNALLASMPPQHPDAHRLASEFITTHQEALANALSGSGPDRQRGLSKHASALIQALAADLNDGTATFSGLLVSLLDRREIWEHDYQDLQAGITRLRNELSQTATPRLEDLLHAARSAIELESARAQSAERITFEEMGQALVHSGERLSQVHDVETLGEVVATVLPVAGLSDAFLSLHAEDADGTLKSWVALCDGSPLRVEECFPSEKLFPSGGYPDARRHTSFVLPLVYEQEQLGIAVFEYRQQFTAYQMFQDQISAALHNVAMRGEVLRQARLLERTTQEREATAQRMEALSVLAGGVAHDLNNYLAPLLALPEVMLGEIAELEQRSGADVTELKADVESIRSVALRASQTIKDLLTLGRQGRTHREPRELNAIVKSALAATSHGRLEREDGRVELTTELDVSQLPVEASEAHLVRVIINLVRNAFDAISGSGSIRVKTRALSLGEPHFGYEAVPPGRYVVAEVIDTGKGIPKEVISRVFEPFFTKKELGERSGSGLGLAIVHSVVKEHDGFLDVESTVGQGTRFTLYFPRSKTEHIVDAPPSTRPTGQGRLLVIGSDPIQLRATQRVLTDLGYEIETRESNGGGVVALDPAQLRGFDVVLIDAQDHDVGSIEALRELLARRPSQRVVLASTEPPPVAESGWSANLTLIEKPYTSGALARAVRRAIG